MLVGWACLSGLVGSAAVNIGFAKMNIKHLHSVGPPSWVRRCVASECLQGVDVDSSQMQGWFGQQGPFSLAQIKVPQAGRLSPAKFQGVITQAYDAAMNLISQTEARCPIRWWNFVPGVHRITPGGLNGYMRFNAGRHEALRRWHHTDQFEDRLATASAVGNTEDDFVLYCLAAEQPGTSLENPRQIPAYHYSERYGPLPPCFTRATAMPSLGLSAWDGMLLLGGTASIVGEATRHVDSLDAQIEETVNNLASLLACAWGDNESSIMDHLAHLQELRVYVVRAQDRQAITQQLTQRMPHLETLELIDAPLCRSELLVEIEGITAPGFLQAVSSSAQPVICNRSLDISKLSPDSLNRV